MYGRAVGYHGSGRSPRGGGCERERPKGSGTVAQPANRRSELENAP